jgi:hypothetical protein
MTLNHAQANINVPSTVLSKENRRSRKFLLKSALIFFGVAVLILVGIGSLNYWLNPLTYSRSEQAKAAAALTDDRNLAIPDSNLDWRALRREQILDLDVVGGARGNCAVCPGDL